MVKKIKKACKWAKSLFTTQDEPPRTPPTNPPGNQNG